MDVLYEKFRQNVKHALKAQQAQRLVTLQLEVIDSFPRVDIARQTCISSIWGTGTIVATLGAMTQGKEGIMHGFKHLEAHCGGPAIFFSFRGSTVIK